MKAMQLTGIRRIEMTDLPEPVISGPKDVKIKLSVLGICGSDIHYYVNGRIGSQVVSYPFAVGHECAGIVIETGKNVRRVKPGDVIAIEPAMPCWECDQCLAGRHHTCRRLKFLGCPGQSEGSLMEYIVMPEESCFPLTGNLNADHGAISEPLAIGVYSVRKSGDIKNLSAGILGFGPIGMSVMLAAKAAGAGQIFVTDKIDRRLDIAEMEGADAVMNPLREDIVAGIGGISRSGLDIVFECCGEQEAVDQAVEILKPGGKLIIVGIPEFEKWKFDADRTRRKEISIQFIRRQVDCVQPSLDMMASGEINIDRMITHRFPFTETKAAFDLVAGYHDGVMKTMIDFE
ncbi:MAG TPA: alcohol dehydrogenase catalytic domain-containing protein [Bacteroidales bacterium]|jgi:L-iditol 2-dehydrogenase|nr:alcohol dehydrogenase catalytic domain-containing protein [Bacteroidales bacterium]HNR43242.1 alcohol dehydrogenase catalytic domain-containing protein [Bacteroidales bacterium]HPM19253.1 alcohol dehydrogenase catalytic domain-containing protein [Bacteroidales bacterium]HQG76661.1 alcohol dehydrogenase catalytic domain-containing protein [Bacteroidales bacterium]